jgi:hypothetical protein
MKLQQEINLLSFTGVMAMRFASDNGIVGAFVVQDDKREWGVLEGNPAEQCGFRAGSFTTRREAEELAARINAALASMLPYAGAFPQTGQTWEVSKGHLALGALGEVGPVGIPLRAGGELRVALDLLAFHRVTDDTRSKWFAC